MVRCHADAGGGPEDVVLLHDTLREIADSQQLGDRLPRTRADIVIQSFLCAALERLGTDTTRQRVLLQRAVNAGILDQSERLPHRIMEERLALEWCDLDHRLPSWGELLADSILGGSTLTPLHVDAEIAYQVTHVLLFLYGFGSASRPPVESLRTERLQPLISDLLVVFCAKRHWDLVGELLLCWDCLALDGTLVSQRAWEAFLAQQADDGSFPPPELAPDPSPPHEHPPEDDHRRRFLGRYHTTLVAILACLRHGRRVEAGAAPTVQAGAEYPDPYARSTRGQHARVKDAALKDATWLSRLPDVMDERGRAADGKVACSILVGLWLCSAIAPDLTSEVARGAARLRATLERVDAWTHLPPALSIVTRGVLAKFDTVVPGLDSFVLDVKTALLAYPPENVASDLSLCEKRVLLHELGLLKSPPLATEGHLAEAAAQLRLDCPSTAVDALLLWLGSRTGYGTVARNSAPRDGRLDELLSGLAVRFLRENKSHTATTLLRNRLYLGFGFGPEPTDFLNFLLLQQRHEGGYGFFGNADGKLLAARGPSLCVDLDLYLPVTLSYLWALAEAVTDWRLYLSIGGTRGPSHHPSAKRPPSDIASIQAPAVSAP